MANVYCIFRVIHNACGFCGGFFQRTKTCLFLCGKWEYTYSQRISRDFGRKNVDETIFIHIFSTICG